ncbi:hypothetical protein BX666DRAFT_1846348, partial [Dichotomocladium elegans]
VYSIDELKTNKCYPECEIERLSKFRIVLNPKHYRRAKNHNGVCHGPLCSNQTCTAPVAEGASGHRLWNRDMVACLNMFFPILKGFHSDSPLLERFRRSLLE